MPRGATERSAISHTSQMSLQTLCEHLSDMDGFEDIHVDWRLNKNVVNAPARWYVPTTSNKPQKGIGGPLQQLAYLSFAAEWTEATRMCNLSSCTSQTRHLIARSSL